METVEKIVKSAFEKAKERMVKQTKTNLSRHIVDALEENGEIINEKSIIRAYNKYIENKKTSSNPSQNTIDAFCKYLGFKNYAAFVDHEKKVQDNIKQEKEKTSKVAKIVNQSKTKTAVVKRKKEIPLSMFIIVLAILFVQIAINLSQKTKQNKAIPRPINIINYYYYMPTGKEKIALPDKLSNANLIPLTYAILNKYPTENEIASVKMESGK